MSASSERSELRVGLFGAGRIALRFHLPLLSAMPGTALCAVADADAAVRERCRRLPGSAAVFADYQELLDSVELDAVVICLPPALHAEAAITSFARGLHVYLEKPLATNVEDGQRVLEAWRSAGRAGWMGFNLRFHQLIAEMRHALRAGDIGDWVAARASFCSAGRELPPWKRERHSGGGALLDLGSHQFDLLHYLLGSDAVEIAAALQSRESEGDFASVQLRFAGGQLASVFCSIAATEQHRMAIVGTEGEIRFDRYAASRLEALPAKRDYSIAGRLHAAAGTAVGFPGRVYDALRPPRELSFKRALHSFLDAARGSDIAGPELDSGLRSLAWVEAAEQAARTGRTVVLSCKGPEYD